MKKRISFAFVFIILLITVISADYSINDYSIDEKYGPGDTLRGQIEISLNNEFSNSIFETSEGDTATLITLINADEDFSSSCIPTNCETDYGASEQEITKTFTLDAEESAIFGFKVTGNKITEILDFSVQITSNVGPLSYPQLFIDIILNDEYKEWQPHTVSGIFGNKIYGCYTTPEDPANIISGTRYCQKITIPSSPNVKIGTNLIGSEEADFIMSIESMDKKSDYGECEISAPSSGERTCEVNEFLIKEKQDYFVCIKAKDSADDGKYQINSETKEPCGFAGNFNNEYTRDFEIFVKPGKYAAIGSFTLNNEEIEILESLGELSVEKHILNYIGTKFYNSCSNGCIVPIKITSVVNNQEIIVSDMTVGYSASGTALSTSNLYNLIESPAKINSDMQNLSIDSGNFAVPNDYGNHIISLSFNGDEIFSKEITVEKVPIIKFVNPLLTAVSYPTSFTVEFESEKSINLYEWNFGDGNEKVTTTNRVIHKYNETGSYYLEIKITDIDGKSSSKNFKVVIGSASIITGTLLQEKKTNLNTIKTQIKTFPEFEQEILEETLDISLTEGILNSSEIANTNAETEEDYQAILKDLLEIRIPQTVFLSATADSILFYPEKTSINIDILTEIAGGTYESSKEDKYIDAVLGWNIQNVDTTMKYKEITASFKDYEGPLFKSFEIDITKKAGSEDDPYIILKKIDGLTFADDYSEEEESGYFYIHLVEESKKIIFSTTEDVDFINLPIFVSPGINKLSLTEFNFIDPKGKLKKWVFFILIISLLLIIGAVFWIILNAWYKKKYENYLFKNKNNLYNLFAWIGNAKKRGLGEGELKTQLKKAGWSSEQLRYVLKKYSGKKTGMPKISLVKKVKKSKKKKIMPQGRVPGNKKIRHNK